MMTLLTFRIRGTLFGVDVAGVREINYNVEYAAVPGAPACITGLFNMRGRIVVLYNLPCLFGYPDHEEKQHSLCIVMESQTDSQGGEGFIIDETGNVIHAAEDSIEPLPPNIHGREARYIRGVIQLDGELLMMLDCKRIFDAGSPENAAAPAARAS